MAIPYPSDGPIERPAGEPTWGIGDAIGGFVAAYLFAILIGSAIFNSQGYHTVQERKDAPIAWTFIANLPLWIGFLAVSIGVAAIKGNGWIRDFHVALKAKDIPLGLVAGVAAQLLLVPAIAYPVLKLSGQTAHDLAKPAQDLADKVHGPGDAIVFAVIVGLVAPVAEEVFFRGLLFRSLENRWGQWWALGISSVVFGATHGEPLQFLPLVAAGAVFGYLVIRTDRLGPAILAHMAFNLTTVVTILWLT